MGPFRVKFPVTRLLVLLHGLRISPIATFDINFNHHVKLHVFFYPSELQKHDQERRPGNNFNYKQFKNSK